MLDKVLKYVKTISIAIVAICSIILVIIFINSNTVAFSRLTEVYSVREISSTTSYNYVAIESSSKEEYETNIEKYTQSCISSASGYSTSFSYTLVYIKNKGSNMYEVVSKKYTTSITNYNKSNSSPDLGKVYTEEKINEYTNYVPVNQVFIQLKSED